MIDYSSDNQSISQNSFDALTIKVLFINPQAIPVNLAIPIFTRIKMFHFPV